PIVFVSVFLTSAFGALQEALLLLLFGALVIAASFIAMRARPPRLLRVLQETVHTTGQTAVRGSIFLLAWLVFVSSRAGFEFVLGAFAAGLIIGLVLESPEGAVVRMRLEGIGFGLLVPIYFVVTGMNFDLDSLLTATGLGLAVLFLALLLLTRGTSSLFFRRQLESRDTLGLAFFGATGLPLIVAIVGIGQSRGAISDAAGASLIGAGMVSVLVFPLVAMSIVGRRGESVESPEMPVTGEY